MLFFLFEVDDSTITKLLYKPLLDGQNTKVTWIFEIRYKYISLTELLSENSVISFRRKCGLFTLFQNFIFLHFYLCRLIYRILEKLFICTI